MEIELHVGGVVSEAGIRMSCEVVEEAINFRIGCFGSFRLFGGYRADCDEGSGVDCACIVQ